MKPTEPTASNCTYFDQELAIFGSPPAFRDPLHVGRPNIGNRERFLEFTGQMFDRLWLTNHGPLVQEFERRIADYVGVRHCICVCNATIGLELAIRALGLHGEVIVPSYTFIATAHALQWQEITPVFADMDPATHNLDPARIERHITPRTTGILATHVWGRPCPVEALTEVAERRGLKLIFDAAHAFGCSHRGKMIGGFGLAEVLSFHATKFVNSFEGGAIVTNDDALATKIRLMANFGFSGYDNVIHLGTNGKMTEVCAAMGLTNLECIADLVIVNRRNHEAYRVRLEGISGVRLLQRDPAEQSNYQYVVVEVDTAKAGLSRDELIQVLHEENVLARKYFWPGCHRMEPYRSLCPHAGMLLADTERVAAQIIVLPTGTAISEVQIATICSIIQTATEHADQVRTAIAAKA
jgi:dTDP-4-amino-4,6-dideoxygalactose transaminase